MIKKKANKLLNELNISKEEKLSNMSKGNIEKLNLVLTLSRNAKLYILDEPIAGVDVNTRQQILKIIIENINEDTSMIICTHLIRDIEQIFDKVCFIKDKTLTEVFDVEELRENGKSVEEAYLEIFGGVQNV